MYRVLGADSKEYGPVSGDVLRQWISEGRANAQTQVKPDGATQWQTLASVPEFEPAFAAAAGAAPTQPLAGAPGPGKTSVLAITSLVLGILGLFTCGVTSLVGLILGIVALVKVSRSGGQLSGKGLAIAGICTSALFLLMVPIYAAMLLPALARAKAKAQTINCLNNMTQIMTATKIYVDDNHGVMIPLWVQQGAPGWPGWNYDAATFVIQYPPFLWWPDKLRRAGLLPAQKAFSCPALTQPATDAHGGSARGR